MPDKNKIINLDAARRKQRGSSRAESGQPEKVAPTYEHLVRLAELEDALETMKQAGIQTVEQLEALIARLEALTSTDE